MAPLWMTFWRSPAHRGARSVSIPLAARRRSARPHWGSTGEAVRQAIAQAAESSESAETFLTRIARGMASDLVKSGYKEGCPIATTALDTSAQSDVLGVATRDGVFKNGKPKSSAGSSALAWQRTKRT